MKTMGLIGGMSWQSTVTYYQEANRLIQARLGGHNSARILLYSVNFAEIEQRMCAGDWDGVTDIVSTAARNLERAGADFLLICTNTVHKVAHTVTAAVGIPLLHIADATAEKIKDAGLSNVGLLGTKYTMIDDFYKGILNDRHGLEVIVPSGKDIDVVNDIIFKELCRGIINESSRDEYIRIIGDLVGQGAQAVIFGCTEIGLLLTGEHCPVPIFDTPAIHVEKAVDTALE